MRFGFLILFYASQWFYLGAPAPDGETEEEGIYTPWVDFGACSTTCGAGQITRSRTCTNGQSAIGDIGSSCSPVGSTYNKTEKCNTRPCPVHGGYTSYGEFGDCSKTCGDGQKTRSRTCTKPSPRHGGRDCSLLGSGTITEQCNTGPCPEPVDGGWSEWGAFGDCSPSCGDGEKTQGRTCSNPSPEHGGRDCSRLGSETNTETCNAGPCPVHGGYTPWGDFGACSQICGDGEKTQSRTCTNPTPEYGGRDCSHLGSETNTEICNIGPCVGPAKLSLQMATMSSTYPIYPASYAIDGITSDGNAYNGNCARNYGGDPPQWWAAELPSMAIIHVIKIFPRQDCCQWRYSNVKVWTAASSGGAWTLCKDMGNELQQSNGGWTKVTCAPNTQGQLIKVTQGNSQQLTLCEIEVYGSTLLTPPPPPPGDDI